MKKRILSMLLVIVMVLALVPVQALADGTGTGSVSITSSAGTELSVYGKLRLSATVSDDLEDKTVTWESNNPEVATVNEKGVVTGKKVADEVTIIAYDKLGTRGTITLKVVEAAQITLLEGTNPLAPEQTLKLSHNMGTEPATWSAVDTKVATVDQNGVVTAVGDGKTNIYATFKNGTISGRYKVTVETPVVAVTDFTLSKTKLNLTVGNSKKVNATFVPEEATDKTLTWSSEDPSVATVADGTITAVGAGDTTITATHDSISKTVAVHVTAAPISVTGLTITDGVDSLLRGESMQLGVKIEPENATNQTVTWEISPATVGTVTDGLVVLNEVGSETSATVTAKCDGQEATFTFAITDPVAVESVTVSQKNGLKEVAAGGTLKLQATVAPTDSTDKTVTWSSSNTDIATVNKNGKVTGVAASDEEVTITATCGGKSGTYTLKVTPAKSIAIEPALPDKLLAGEALSLKAVVKDAVTGETLTDKVEWKLLTEDEGIRLNGTTLETSSDLEYRHTVKLEASAVGSGAKAVEKEILVMPRTDSIVLKIGEQKVTNQVYTVNLNDPSLVTNGIIVSAFVQPSKAEGSVRWQIIDENNLCVDEQLATDVKIKPSAALKSGTVTIKAFAGDGTGVSATTTIQFAKLGMDILVEAPTQLRGGASVNLGSLVKLDKDLDDKTVIWSIEDNVVGGKKIATIGSGGKLTTKAVTEPCVIKVKATVKATGTSDTKEITLYPATKTIKVTGADKTIKYQDDLEIALSATVQPAAADVWDLKWSSSNPKVAEVDPDTGKVTVLDAGKVRITCETTDGSKVKGYLYLEITKAAKRVVIEAPAEDFLIVGQSVNLKARVMAGSGVEAANQKVTWSITDAFGRSTSAATISSSGRVTARNVTQNTVVVVTAASVENPDISATCQLTIRPTVNRSLQAFADGKLISGELPMDVGSDCTIVGKWQMSETGKFEKAKNCEFISGNTKIADFDEFGTLTAKHTGSAVITVRCYDPDTDDLYTSTFNLRVANLPGIVTVTKPNAYLRSGGSMTLKATAWRDGAYLVQATNQNFTWEVREVVGSSTKDTEAATISTSGKLTALDVKAKTTVRVYAISQENSVYGTVDVDIYPSSACRLYFMQSGKEVSGSVTRELPGSGSMELSDLAVYAYVTVPVKNGKVDVYSKTPVEGTKLTWKSSNDKVIKIVSGVPTYVGTGSAKLTATYKCAELNANFSASIYVNVVKSTGGVTVVQADPSRVLASGKSIYMRAEPINAGATNTRVIWSLAKGDEAFATINASTGKLTAKRGITEQETVTVTATPVDGSTAGTKVVTIYPAATKVVIKLGGSKVGTTQRISLASASGKKLSAEVSPSDAKGACQSVKWTSSNTSVVDIASDGTLTVKKAGNVTIKATTVDGYGKTAKFKLRITK